LLKTFNKPYMRIKLADTLIPFRVVYGKTSRGLNITKLFKALPKSVQEEIVSHDAIARRGCSDAHIECELLAISDGFEKWRYAYESTALRYNYYFAKVLIEALRFVASKRMEGP